MVRLRWFAGLVLAPAVVLVAADVRTPVRPVGEWTARFTTLVEAGDGETLDRELQAIKAERPDLYDRFWLAHLQGRARLLKNDPAGARAAWEPLAASGHPLRDLALYDMARAADAEGRSADASRYREALIFGAPGASRQAEAIDEQANALVARGDADALSAFADRVAPVASRAARRRIDGELVALRLRRGDIARATTLGARVLRDDAADDVADRVGQALDRPDALALLDADGRARVGESARIHRRAGRAVALLTEALAALPARRDDLLFSIGRTYYVAEDYAAAERTYRTGAATRDAVARSRFLYHAARSAQLRGDDRQAEGLLLQSLAAAPRQAARRARARRAARSRVAPDGSRACLARLHLVRLMASERRFQAADPHLRGLRAAGCEAEAGEAVVAYASAAVASGHSPLARTALASMPPAGASRAEGEYWSARALEVADPEGALDAHLALLRPATVSPFAHFARARLAGPLAPRAHARVLRLEQAADAARQRGDRDAARRLLTDAVLLGPNPPAGLERLRALYSDMPAYAPGLDLQPLALPRLTADAGAPSSRTDLLLALGLFDDAADGVGERFSGSAPESALTRALLLRRGGRARASIRAAEGVVAGLPPDFLPELLPADVRDVLYPRYYLDVIEEDARRFGADPHLVLAIMREESRFDTRARSAAAARGLLQIVLTTAREVARGLGMPEVEAQDLYDPALVIPLGAKYLADLQRDFGGNLLKAAAAYNAGPRQARLWSRLAPDAGDDAYFASISFAETRRYVAQVLSSYDRYRATEGDNAAGNARRAGAARAR